MNWIKLIFTNVAITFALFGVLILTPPFVFSIYQLTKNQVSIGYFDKISQLEAYSNIDWKTKHFTEFHDLSTKYHDYITWRRDGYRGETITITNGLRRTFNSSDANIQATKYWFFGGSTTWGTGVDDMHTSHPFLQSLKVQTLPTLVNLGI
jgi:hypothetical protein